jgi:hypothetical protein
LVIKVQHNTWGYFFGFCTDPAVQYNIEHIGVWIIAAYHCCVDFLLRLKAAIEKGIVYCFPVWFCHDSQILPKFGNKPPVTDASIGLHFCPDRGAEDSHNPFLSEIVATYHDTATEVVCSLHVSIRDRSKNADGMLVVPSFSPSGTSICRETLTPDAVMLKRAASRCSNRHKRSVSW